MTNAFLDYYQLNTEIAPDHTILQRWRELSTQVLPPMMEEEMIKWFIDNL